MPRGWLGKARGQQAGACRVHPNGCRGGRKHCIQISGVPLGSDHQRKQTRERNLGEPGTPLATVQSSLRIPKVSRIPEPTLAGHERAFAKKQNELVVVSCSPRPMGIPAIGGATPGEIWRRDG